jgi:hypothetical protein
VGGVKFHYFAREVWEQMEFEDDITVCLENVIEKCSTAMQTSTRPQMEISR